MLRVRHRKFHWESRGEDILFTTRAARPAHVVHIDGHRRPNQTMPSGNFTLLAGSFFAEEYGAAWDIADRVVERPCLLPAVARVGPIAHIFQASANRRRQHGHSPSQPLRSAENAVGCGIVMIALN